ncbi:MAG: M48 family metallopeptidase [Bacteroidales bacterium]
MKNQPFQDAELGLITIKPHGAARNFIFRTTDQGIQITCPVRVTRQQILDALEQQRPKLTILLRKKVERPLLERGTILQMTGFQVHITESGYGNLFQARFANETLELVCPCDTDYKRAEVQNFFHQNIVKVLKYKADRYLPNRLKELAAGIGKSYLSCKVSYGKQRLGRCDSRGEILLSYRLMLLPSHLSDYVILHELAHLTEMNHGPRFHALLNHYCKGEHRLLEKELKEFRYPF